MLSSLLNFLALFFLIISYLMGLAMNIFALPGTVLIFLVTLAYGAFTGFQAPTVTGIIIMGGLVICAEILEYLTTGYGAVKFGAGKWGVAGAVAGSIIGGIAGNVFLFIVGTLPGLILGAFLGGFLAETVCQTDFRLGFKAGMGSMVGRVGALFAKSLISLLMIGMSLYQIFF